MATMDREELTCIGYVQQAHGIRGDLKVVFQTDTPEFYQGIQRVFLATKDRAQGNKAQGQSAVQEYPVRQIQPAGAHWRAARQPRMMGLA